MHRQCVGDAAAVHLRRWRYSPRRRRGETWAPHIEPHLAAFARSRLVGERALPELAGRAADEWRLPRHLCAAYLAEECVYEPGPEMHAALRAFRDAAAPLGLCDGALDPQPVEAFRAHLG
jgi:hypothetical protein